MLLEKRGKLTKGDGRFFAFLLWGEKLCVLPKVAVISFHTLENSVVQGMTSASIADAKNVDLGTVEFKFPPVGGTFTDNYPVWVTYVTTTDGFRFVLFRFSLVCLFLETTCFCR